MTATPQHKSPRALKLAQLFSEAAKRGIEQDDLRNVIAPGVIGHRLSEATTGEIIEVIRHITGNPADKPASLQAGKHRFEDLGYRDGMATPRQLRQIEAMWMDVSTMPHRAAREKALKGFLKRIVGVEDLRFVEDWMVRKVVRAIEAMKQQGRRS